jgi:flagellar M-ring protein FliF
MLLSAAAMVVVFVNALWERFQKLGPIRIYIALGVAAIAAALVLLFVLRGGNEDKALLFSDVEMSEAGKITEQLTQANIPFELRGDGTSIYVARSKVLEARMMLSAQGLPSRGSVGYEIFDSQDALGATQFQQNINRLRALEGELARTIASLDVVDRARVHLVLPERRLFERETDAPSASIVLKLKRDDLTAGQVRAVRNLVASAVPGLSANRVTIADESGKLLASASDEGGLVAAEELDQRQAVIEERLKREVMAIVESVVGPRAARVEVNADIDFNRVTQNSETFDPEGRVVRSTSTVEESSNSQERGEDGAATAGRNVPNATGAADDGPQNAANSNRTEETTNFEISKTTRTEIIEGGRIRRLSVAVAIDGVMQPGADGAPAQWAPRDQADLDRISTLVRSAVGFDEARGDRVDVVNVRFAPTGEDGASSEDQGLLDFTSADIMRGAELLAGLVALMAVLFFVVRPMLSGAKAKQGDASAANDGEAGVGATAALDGPGASGAPALGGPDTVGETLQGAELAAALQASTVARLKQVVAQNPGESVQVVRGWLHSGVNAA